MSTEQIYEVHASGYKPHLCSTEKQAELVVQDIKMRKPQSECNTRLWDLPYLCYDDAHPLVIEEDFILVDLPGARLKFCIADFQAMMSALNASMEFADDGLVYLTSAMYCSVLTIEQATNLRKYLHDNYEMIKQREDVYFFKNEEAIKTMASLTTALHGKKKPTIIN